MSVGEPIGIFPARQHVYPSLVLLFKNELGCILFYLDAKDFAVVLLAIELLHQKLFRGIPLHSRQVVLLWIPWNVQPSEFLTGKLNDANFRW